MIDLHCHFLPGIDDGAKSLSESLDLARYAVNEGITHSVLTPHLHLGRYENFRTEIEQELNAFRQALEAEGIELKLGFAAEVRVCPDIMTWISEDKIPFLGSYEGYQILLLEMPHNQVPPGIDNLIRWLIGQKVRPIIAHPERNKEIMATPNKILPLVNAGALIQLTADAVAGEFGAACHATSKYILKQDLATILATDAHNLKHRPPSLEKGRRQVEVWCGESRSWDLVLNTPQAIAEVQF